MPQDSCRMRYTFFPNLDASLFLPKKNFPPSSKQHHKTTEAEKAPKSSMRCRGMRRTIFRWHHSHHLAKLIWMSSRVWAQDMSCALENRVSWSWRNSLQRPSTWLFSNHTNIVRIFNSRFKKPWLLHIGMGNVESKVWRNDAESGWSIQK